MDIPVRVLHWSIALAVFLNLFVLEEGDLPHRISGYVAVSSVCLRAIWAFVKSGSAGLNVFSFSPAEFIKYIKTGFEEIPGKHNPIASWTYLAIWICVIALASTGWMMGLDYFWGDDDLEDIHELFANILLGLTIIHLIGMSIDSLRYRRHTWLKMFTGRDQF